MKTIVEFGRASEVTKGQVLQQINDDGAAKIVEADGLRYNSGETGPEFKLQNNA